MSVKRPAEQPPDEHQYPTVRIKMRGVDSQSPPSTSPPPQPLWQPASSSASPKEDEELPSWAWWGKEEDANDPDASHARTAAADGHGSSCRYCALVVSGPGGNLRQHEKRCLAQHQAVEAARGACAACGGGKHRKHTCVAVARSGGGGSGKQAEVEVVAVEVVDEGAAGSQDAESATVVEVEEQLPLQLSSRTTTGYKGVYKKGNRFRAQIYLSGVPHTTDLGVYATAVEGAEAYARAAAAAETAEPSSPAALLPASAQSSGDGSHFVLDEDAPTPPRARKRKRSSVASSSHETPASDASSPDAPPLEDAPMPPSHPSWPAPGEASDPISQARGELVEALCKLQSHGVRRPRPVQQSAASGEDAVVQPPKNIYVLTPHPGSGFWMGSDLVSI